MRDASGELRAFRNSCTAAPHTLTAAAAGHLTTIKCAVHGLQFGLDGKHRGERSSGDLTHLDLRMIGDFMLVRSAVRAAPSLGPEDSWADLKLPSGSRLSQPPTETLISADWKLLVEQCLESAAAARGNARRGWSAAAYERVMGSAVDFGWRAQFIAPNHLIESRPDGFTILQVLPSVPGRCLLRRHNYTVCAAARTATAMQYLASRLRQQRPRSMIAIAESTQKGLAVFGNQTAQGAVGAPETAAFRQYLIARIAALARDRPPAEP